jgi:hypothetical protein
MTAAFIPLGDPSGAVEDVVRAAVFLASTSPSGFTGRRAARSDGGMVIQ